MSHLINKKTKRGIYRKIAYFSIMLFVLTASANATYNSVILITLDGAQKNHTIELLGKNQLPNMLNLSKSGDFTTVIITDHGTATGQGTAQLLTGHSPFDTCFFETVSSGICKEKSAYKAIPDGLTIFEVLNTSGFTTGFIAGRNDSIPPGWYNGQYFQGASFPDKELEYAKPEINYWYSPPSYGSPNTNWSLPKSNGNQIRANVIAEKAIDFIDTYSSNRFFLYVHFTEPDFYGHQYNENSEVYDQSIQLNDHELGRILKELEILGIAESTLVIVTTDHGFVENGYEHYSLPPILNGDPDCYDIWMINDKVNFSNPDKKFDQKDIAGFIYHYLGVNHV